ncbi:MAG TPA: tetratricopeptide repeat protein [Micropepsaceae bacterium]|nr:tetratricopeptide repeat protein [Micropepsaceae bacterium]
MSDIFQEVEEDVRRERYEQLWKKYGNYVIAAAGVLVLGVGAFQGWRAYDLRQRQAVSDRYQAAQQLAQTGDAAKAEEAFASLAKDAPSGYAMLAKFHLAGQYLAQGKRDPAVALLQELANGSDPVLSNTARLRLAWLLADASPKAEVMMVLQPLNAPDSPWRFSAQEVIAYIDFKDGQRGQAQAEYEKLAQEAEAPPSLRQRAGGIAEFIRANPGGVPLTPPPPSLPSLPSTPGATAPAPAAPALPSAPAKGAK